MGFFKGLERAGQGVARRENRDRRWPDREADDKDAHLRGLRAVQDVGRHDGAVLGEGVRQVFAVPSTAGLY
jgi:hypothetical protein